MTPSTVTAFAPRWQAKRLGALHERISAEVSAFATWLDATPLLTDIDARLADSVHRMALSSQLMAAMGAMLAIRNGDATDRARAARELASAIATVIAVPPSRDPRPARHILGLCHEALAALGLAASAGTEPRRAVR